jgi:hypothetical protein
MAGTEDGDRVRRISEEARKEGIQDLFELSLSWLPFFLASLSISLSAAPRLRGKTRLGRGLAAL